MSAAPRTWWGWHQLADRWAERLVDRAGVSAGDLVLDVGAGAGAITAHLIERGARVIAVELHPARAAELRRRFAGADVRVVRADAADLRLPGRPFRVVANPPFAVTTALIRRLVHPRSQLVRAELIVPRHAAGRWAGDGGRPDRRGRAASVTFELAWAGRVPREAFRPSPPDDAALLSIVRSSSSGAGRGRRG